MERNYAVYIMTNESGSVLYTGVTGDIGNRVEQHRRGCGSQFARKYHLTRVVYLEFFDFVWDAIYREKQIKAGSRAKKIKLIEQLNPQWRGLMS